MLLPYRASDEKLLVVGSNKEAQAVCLSEARFGMVINLTHQLDNYGLVASRISFEVDPKSAFSMLEKGWRKGCLAIVDGKIGIMGARQTGFGSSNSVIDVETGANIKPESASVGYDAIVYPQWQAVIIGDQNRRHIIHMENLSDGAE